MSERSVTLPVLLSLNGGFVDTAGFLAFKGLFTAHVTGNFVTIAATLISGASGLVTKLLALPVFCVVVVIVKFACNRVPPPESASPATLLSAKLLLLSAGAVMAIVWGPFSNADAPEAMLAGLTLVAAMAIQNALHRIHLGTAPPSTLMTGTTTQLMLDIADGFGVLSAEQQAARRQRMQRMAHAIAAFAIGAALAAMLFKWTGMWCFAAAPFIALAARLSTPPVYTMT